MPTRLTLKLRRKNEKRLQPSFRVRSGDFAILARSYDINIPWKTIPQELIRASQRMGGGHLSLFRKKGKITRISVPPIRQMHIPSLMGTTLRIWWWAQILFRWSKHCVRPISHFQWGRLGPWFTRQCGKLPQYFRHSTMTEDLHFCRTFPFESIEAFHVVIIHATLNRASLHWISTILFFIFLSFDRPRLPSTDSADTMIRLWHEVWSFSFLNWGNSMNCPWCEELMGRDWCLGCEGDLQSI